MAGGNRATVLHRRALPQHALKAPQYKNFRGPALVASYANIAVPFNLNFEEIQYEIEKCHQNYELLMAGVSQ